MEWIFPVAFFGIFIVIFIVSNINRKKRAQAIERVAADLNFEYSREGDESMISSLGMFQLFSQGRRKKVENLLSGYFDDMDVSICDYRYTTGHGKHSQTHRQTVLIFKSNSLRLPDFSLRPENIFHKIGGAFGYKDIDFDDYEIFSKKFLLRGSDELAIRDIFNGSVLTYYEGNEGLCTEGNSDTLIIYRASKKVSPEDIKPFYDMGYTVFGLFKRYGY